MKIVPYLYFDGTAEEAINFYKEALGAESTPIMRYKDNAYPGMAEGIGERVLHSELKIGDQLLYFSDVPDTSEVQFGNNLQININFDTEEELRKVFAILSEGADITTELEETFWNAIYGTLTDKFGVFWSLNYQR